jgi:predicted RNase H-like HicB family nuclease
MGLEFKPYFWEDDEEHDRHVKRECEKQTTANSEQSDISEDSSVSGGHGEEDAAVQAAPQQPRGGLVFVHADGTPPAAPVAPALGSRELAPALAAVNTERREYAALVASEEDDVSEYKSFFCIVLDHPQFLGQGETKESALRQARMFFHYSLGSMLLKNETIPAPSSGAELEGKKAAMERDWSLVKLENFSMELVPLQFQPGIDYLARPPESDGEYESDREDEELFELESRMSTP